MAVILDGIAYEEGVTAIGYSVRYTGQQKYSTRTVNDPPRVMDIEASFGTAAEVGSGYMGVLNPNGDGTLLYLCVCDGANWWIQAMTAAAV